MLKRGFLVVLFFVVILSGCKPVDPDTLALQIESEIQKRELTSEIKGTITRSEASPDVERQNTATAQPTDTPVPTLTASPKQPQYTLVPTSTVTFTQSITDGAAISPTILISTTQVLTATWVFSDVEVVSDAAINQVSWVDGTLLASATSLGLYLHHAKDLTLAGSFNLGEPVLSLAYVPDVGLLTSGDHRGNIQWQDPFSGAYAATTGGHAMGVTDLIYPEDGFYLVSGSDDGTVRTWFPSFVLNQDYLSTSSIDLWRGPDRITCVDSDLFTTFVAGGSFQRVSIWSPVADDPVHEIDGLTGWVNDLEISPDDQYLAVADSSNHLRMWHTGTWSMTHNIPIESVDTITALSFSPDGYWLALGSKNGRILVWDLEENTISGPFEPYPSVVTDLAFHPFEPRLISSFQNGVLRVWDIQP